MAGRRDRNEEIRVAKLMDEVERLRAEAKRLGVLNRALSAELNRDRSHFRTEVERLRKEVERLREAVKDAARDVKTGAYVRALVTLYEALEAEEE